MPLTVGLTRVRAAVGHLQHMMVLVVGCMTDALTWQKGSLQAKAQPKLGLPVMAAHVCMVLAGANTTWWNVYSPSRQLGLPTVNGAVDCGAGPLLNWIGPFASRWALAVASQGAAMHLLSCRRCITLWLFVDQWPCCANPTLLAADPNPTRRVLDGTCSSSTRWTVDNIGAGRSLYPPDLFRAMRSYWYLLSS